MMQVALVLIMGFLMAQQSFIAVAESIGDDILWKNASRAFLQQVYTKHDFCVLTKQDPMTSCKRMKTDVESTCSILTNQKLIHGHMHQLPKSMYHLPAMFADIEPSKHPLTSLVDMFIMLNRTNKALMLIGDSISRQSIEALECILSIEKRSEMVTIDPPVTKVLWGATKYTISLSSAETNHEPVTVSILYFAVWNQYGNGAEVMFRKEAKRLLKHNPTTSIIFVFNIGMHEKYEASQHKHVYDILTNGKKEVLSMKNRSNLVLYRESSAQHYNSTAGYFNQKQSEKWKTKKLPLPTCVPYEMVKNDINDWRYNGEQSAIKYSRFDYKDIIPFRDLSRHYFDVHSSSPFFKPVQHRNGPDRDCTHFIPHAAPILYRILWYRILQRSLQHDF